MVATKKAPVKKVVARKGGKPAPPEPVMTKDVTKATVDELPPARAMSNRQLRFANKMAEVREKVGYGVWTALGTFTSPHGARLVRNAMEAGERPVDGELDDWDIEARRNDAGGSTLWARLRG